MKESEKELPVNHQPSPQQPMHYYQVPPMEDEIDLFELFASIFAQWKLISTITVIGALLSVTIALIIPKVYETTTTIRTPTASQVAAINENGLNKFTGAQLFKRLYDQAKSKDNLRNHLIKTNSLPKLIPNFKADASDKIIYSFLENFKTTLLEPEAPKGGIVKIPELFQLSLLGHMEAETVTFLNGYTQYIEKLVIDNIIDNSTVVVALRSNRLNQDIALLRNAAKRNRELLIDKLIVENQEKIEKLQQKIALLRTGAKENRQLLIKKMEENNATIIESLKQQIALLEEQKKKEINSQIANLKEANQLAKITGIKKPTTLDLLAASNKSSSALPQTQVNVSSSDKSMNFLFGTEYLSSQIEILKNRKNITQFIPNIRKLESQIETIKSDKKILELQNRTSDDPYIEGLQNHINQISALENDKRIAALQSRKSDDPFIEALPNKLRELDNLKHISFDFGDASLYQVDQAAVIDGKAEKPNRKLIAVLGTLLSGMVAFFIALIVSTAQKRALRGLDS